MNRARLDRLPPGTKFVSRNVWTGVRRGVVVGPAPDPGPTVIVELEASDGRRRVLRETWAGAIVVELEPEDRP